MDFDVLADDQRDLLQEAASLKGDMVTFALTPAFERPLRECARRCAHPDLDDLSQGVESIESLLFEHRYDDGSTVLDRYVARHRQLTEQARALIDSWNDSVHGIFEVAARHGDLLLMTNLFDEMQYTAYAGAGAESIEEIQAGSFLITRVLPVDNAWLLSGSQTMFLAQQRAAMAQVVAQRFLEHPDLVLRNPAKRRAAIETAQTMHESFVECFGRDLLIVSGTDATKTYQRFLDFHNRRMALGDEAARRSRPTIDASPFEEALAGASTVAIEHHPDNGIWFYAEYGLVSETFTHPELAKQERHREAVRGYLHDEAIPPWVFQRLGAESPEGADAVFRSVLGRPDFCWAEDGDDLLRQHKSDYFRSPRVSPGIVPAPAIVLEHLPTVKEEP